jgi:hypothetical protein
LFPRESVLLDVLGQINHHELQHLWAEDETIGWIYQYFNSQEERKAMRDESSAPRNSRELAVRNQFFTPRYVVEFLTDNTLGRIWYEMTQGQTRLVDECKYLVRRPDEVFLSHMTCKDQEHRSEGTIAMGELLLSGTEETFPEFSPRDTQPMIELGHCVSAYTTMGDRAHQILGNQTLEVRERRPLETREIADAVDAAPFVLASQLESLKTQHILEVLFMTCRNDRHGGDGSVYSESWFVDACNEVRRRVLNSRRDDLTQEELLRQPVFIPYRPMKDPRDIKMLDPACGSMHFGLYAFDLFLSIYEEAWELEERLGEQAFVRPREIKSLRDSYGTREGYILDVPRLIIERNIHGIDIDSRAVQIAGLSLWLRAQKAWHEAGIKPTARPQIKQSNIVCAEPMPGEADLLEQFIADQLSQTSGQQTIASIVRRVFDAMKLAGEAGSLLKIEEEISVTIAEAKKKWVEGPKAVQLPLFSIDEKQKDPGPRPLLVAGIDDASFWDEIEERIYTALKNYAEQATSGQGFQRRLFAEDAARGFSFIDNCRKRYDVILMNPPFGDPPERANKQLQRGYLAVKHDLASAFLERGRQILSDRGLLGCISTRTLFFLSYLGEWREQFFLRDCGINLFCDLGVGVLDAMVETAMYTIGSHLNKKPHALFFKASDVDDRGLLLDNLLRGFQREHLKERIFVCDPLTFRHIPKSPFAYWVPDKIRNLFSDLPPFETSDRHGHIGALSQDDFRFVRLWWEVPPQLIGTNWTKNTFLRWVPYTKGGTFAPYYMDIPALLNWEQDGEELKAFLVAYRQDKGFADQWTGQLNAYDLYFSQGLTWSSRPLGQGSFWVMPRGCIFRHSAPAIIDLDSDALFFDLAIMNSLYFRFLLDLLMPRGSTGTATLKYELGYVRSVPVPQIPNLEAATLVELAKDTTRLLMNAYCSVEEAHLFVSPSLASFTSLKEGLFECQKTAIEVQQSLGLKTTRIDSLLQRFYSMDGELGENLLKVSNVKPISESVGSYELWREWSPQSEVNALISYLFGTTIGRWDVRYVTGEKDAAELPDPFAPLPVCSHGQLQNSQSLPASPEEVPASYPVKNLPWNGILVDDLNHPRDIECRIREIIEIIWAGSASGSTPEEIEQEACDVLGVKSIRDYFRKPAGFFIDHLSRYSKSRRQAPIYWPLSTDSGNYTLWLYYHRLTDQTLYTAVNDFIEPKQKQVNADLNLLRSKDKRSRDDEAELERLTDLSSELEDFRKELLRIADLWKPNLNDGVQITAAPLWKFFRLKKWRDTLKKTWNELEEGKYDWAHLALSIWPARVVRAAHKDRSIAIAHRLEGALWHEVEIKKSSKTGRVTVKHEWQPRELSEKELDAIVAKVKSGEIGTDNAAPAEVANG